MEGKDPEITIIQRWNGYTTKINLLLGSFHAHLVDQRIRELQREQGIKSKVSDKDEEE